MSDFAACTASRSMIAALIFCNLKLAALLVQIFFGRLGTQQKFYEVAISEFVFVSQLVLIAALTYLALVLCARGRSQALLREA